MLNPYDLLGVTIDSSKEEVKKKYYELSLLVHPDKGGNAEDMICLQTAYKFVMREIEVIDKSLTVEQLENEFKEFCATQEKQVPMFQDIYAEAFDLPKFNEYFDDHASEVMGASVQGGYGDLMEKSTLASDYVDKETTPVANEFNAMSLYRSPMEMNVSQNVYDLTTSNKQLDNYSMEVNGMHMSDYREAFTAGSAITEDVVHPPLSRTLEELIAEREQNGFKEETALKSYTWSFEGLLDSTRKRISDYFRLG
jgi:hypothetical protein